MNNRNVACRLVDSIPIYKSEWTWCLNGHAGVAAWDVRGHVMAGDR